MIELFTVSNLKDKCLIELDFSLNKHALILLFINKNGILIRLIKHQWIYPS